MAPNYIRRVHIKNYRSLVNTTVELSPLTVLVGKNGSGKSNFLDALHFVGDAVRLGLETANRNRGGYYIGSPEKPVDFVLDINIDSKSYGYELLLGERKGSRRIEREVCTINDRVLLERNGDAWTVVPEGVHMVAQPTILALPLLAGFPDFEPLHRFLVDMSFYELFPDTIRRSVSQRPAIPTPLDENGENLASVLKHLLEMSSWGNSLKSSLSTAIPFIQDIAVEDIGGRLLIRVDYEDIPSFGLEFESDGTMRFVALLAALYQDPSRALLGIEEPELFIHVGILDNLADDIAEASLRSQVILTTQSPDMVHYFNVNNLRIVERTSEGTKIGLVDDIQRQVIEEQLFKASDLLRIDGELQRTPTPDGE